MNENIVLLECLITLGKLKDCGKTYLRNPLRNKIGKACVDTPVEVLLSDFANKLMKKGDVEPACLPKATVLHTAKHEYVSSLYHDKDPIKALGIMKATLLPNVIHRIGYDPFFVHYFTNHQMHIYNTYATQEISSIAIDATGGIVGKFKKQNDNETGPIFLYIIVINCTAGQFSVSQMLSESHTAGDISFWLNQWRQLGAKQPKEIITDQSYALLNAAAISFANCNSIDEYANNCKTKLPNCWIRLDVAHFLNGWRKFLKSFPQRVRIFYLSLLGRIIRATSIEQSEQLLKSFFIISLSETEGQLKNGQLTECEIEKKKIDQIITTPIDDELEEESAKKETESLPLNDSDSFLDNSWVDWAKTMIKELDNKIKQDGDRDNAHYSPKAAEHMIKDMKLFPLWSNVLREQFGYGRNPASSASVESEFNKIKNIILHKTSPTERPDVVLEKHCNYLTGKMKRVESQLKRDSESSFSEIEEPIASHSNEFDEPMSVHSNEYIQPMCDNSDEADKTILTCSSPKYSTSPKNKEHNLSKSKDIINELINSRLKKSSDLIVTSNNNSTDHLSADLTNDTPQNVLKRKRSSTDVELSKKDIKNTIRPIVVLRDVTNNVSLESHQKSSSFITCPACKNGDLPTDAHKCFTCGCNVHVLDQCSVCVKSSEEGYGQKRYCYDCYILNQSLSSTSKAARKLEDWHGLVTADQLKKKKAARYLGNNVTSVKNGLNWKNHVKLPVLRNGGDCTMASFKVNRKIQYSFTNTCAIDSIIQIFLAGITDYQKLHEKIQSQTDSNDIYRLVLNIANNKVTAQTYNERGRILLKYFPADENGLVDCNCNVGNLVNNIFKNLPSFKEEYACNQGCEMRIRNLPVLSIEYSVLLSKECKNRILKEVFISQRLKCPKTGCGGLENRISRTFGDIVLIDIFSMKTEVQLIKLVQLPVHIDDPYSSTETKFTLIGVIKHRCLSARRGATTSNNGHYTPIAYRNGIWYEYDDLKGKEVKLNGTSKLNPALLIFGRI